MKVRELHDTDGHTEIEVMTEKEVTEAVQKWSKENYGKAVLIEDGIFQYSQTNGIRKGLQVDVRNGEVSVYEKIPNQYNANDSFFISLCDFRLLDFSETEMVEGADMVVTLEKDRIFAFMYDTDNFDELEKIFNPETNTYTVDWYENEEFFDLKKFINEGLKEDYQEWFSNYEEWLMEDVVINYSGIIDFYNESEEIFDYYKD